METELNYVGLAGTGRDATANPINAKPLPFEEVKRKYNITLPANVPLSKKDNFLNAFNKVFDYANSFLELGGKAANVYALFKHPEDAKKIYVTNPNTGASSSLYEIAKKEAQNNGIDSGILISTVLSAFRDMQPQPQPYPQPQPQPKDNTLLYVGLGFGALVFMGLIVFTLKK